MTAFAFDVAMAALGVNGPEDVVRQWDAINWRLQEDNVRRLRGRIFKATKDGDWPTVRNLQRMMLRSWSNTLVGVRQVTQRYAGRKTAGIDGQVALTSPARMGLAVQAHRTARSFKPLAVKRVYIPKANGNSARSEFPSSRTASTRRGTVMRWNPSGRPGSNPSRPGSGRVVAARTRSQLST